MRVPKKKGRKKKIEDPNAPNNIGDLTKVYNTDDSTFQLSPATGNISNIFNYGISRPRKLFVGIKDYCR